MDVILLEDVKALGKKGDLVKVNDGYARNYILPRKLGVEATAKNKNDLKLQKEHQAREEKRLYDEIYAKWESECEVIRDQRTAFVKKRLKSVCSWLVELLKLVGKRLLPSARLVQIASLLVKSESREQVHR